jgi:hypothetical protein
MRRALLGGLGVALGVLGHPAVAQELPGRVPDRAARLGRPVAVQEVAPIGEVTLAGLVARGQAAPAGATVVSVGQPVPVGRPIPIGQPVPLGQPFALNQQPGTTTTPPMPLPGSQPPMTGNQLPQPRPIGDPRVTEIRDPSGRVIPNGLWPVPTAVAPPESGMFVPSVLPGGGECPQPWMDDPLLCPPGMSALDRAACGTRYWTTAEYLLWWTRSAPLPVLVTTSSPASNGFLGAPDTRVVFGGQPFGETLHGGARFGGGWWFTDGQCRGIDARMFFLGRNGSAFSTNTNQFPVLARPFFNVNAPFGSYSELVGSPGLAVGSVASTLQNTLWGAEVNYRRNLIANPCSRLDGLVGYRFLNFKEELTVTEAFLRTPDSPMTVGAPALAGMISDQFRTENNFHGGQIGLTGEIRRGRWFLDGRASVAFGQTFQTAEIGGGQALAFGNGQVGQFQGGLLAVPGANIGTFRQDKFAVLPEVGFNVGYHLTPHLRLFVGYNFLYLSNVLRPGDVINTNIDAARIPNFPLPNPVTPLPGVPQPTPLLRTTDFWAQGINFGLQFTW